MVLSPSREEIKDESKMYFLYIILLHNNPGSRIKMKFTYRPAYLNYNKCASSNSPCIPPTTDKLL